MYLSFILLIYIVTFCVIPTINIASFYFNISLFYSIISRFAFVIEKNVMIQNKYSFQVISGKFSFRALLDGFLD